MNKLSIHDFFNNNKIISGIHFISIGCAKLLDDNKMSPDYYQQYPPFISDIKNKYSNINITLILIDPIIEELPFCITTQLNEYSWHNDKYYNEYITKNKTKGSIYIYVFNESVDWMPDEKNKNSINIYNNLITYQNKILENKESLLFFHDFTGRNTADLAEIMDDKLKDNRKYILYDISIRNNEGCYVKLTDNINKPILIIQNDRLEIFNPYNVITNNDTLIQNLRFSCITSSSNGLIIHSASLFDLRNAQSTLSCMIQQSICHVHNEICLWEDSVILYRQLLSEDAKKIILRCQY